MTGDLGACWLLDELMLQNPIKIVHWGLQVWWGGARGPEGQEKQCDVEAYVDAAMHVCGLLQVSSSQYNGIPNDWWAKINPVNKRYNCFKHEKDGGYLNSFDPTPVRLGPVTDEPM